MVTATPKPLPPLTGAKLAIGTVALLLVIFMNVLGPSIANVSILAISGDLGVVPNQGTWVIASFAVVNAISVPLTGWLTQRFGRMRPSVTSIPLFALSSWACGLAPNIGMLIVARIIQGVVAGSMIPLSQPLLLSAYLPVKSSMVLALQGMMTLIASIMGLIFGGWISDNMSWSWIFYINIPVGILAAYATWVTYKDHESLTCSPPTDKIGLALLILWVGSPQLMLDRGKELDWFSLIEVMVLTAVVIVGFASFLIWELTRDHPVMDLTLFKDRNFNAGVAAISVVYDLFLGNLVILLLWLQTIVGCTATDAGLIMAPVGISAIILSSVIGKNLPKMDARWAVTTASMTSALVFWMRSRFTVQTDIWTSMILTLIQGVVMATFFIPLTSIILPGLSPEQIPTASGLSNFVRIMSGGIGASISTTVWDNRSALHHVQPVEHADSHNPAYASSTNQYTQLGVPNLQANGVIERAISQQAAMLGANDVFWISAVLFIVLIVFIWLTKPVKSVAGAEAAAGTH